MNATTEQIERAKAMQVKCPKISLERLIEMEVKKDLRNTPKQMTKKDYIQQEIRNSESNMTMVDVQNINEEQMEKQRKLLY